MKTPRRSLAVFFLLTLPLVTPKIRGADEIEYFAYLRSLAFDGDLEFGNEYEHFYRDDPKGLSGFKATFLDRLEPLTGRHINFAPMGSALLWSPFYALAHMGVTAARAMGSAVAADGFSKPYVAAVCYASTLYGFLGLLLVHDALGRHGGFAEPAGTLCVVGSWLGTPLLYYMTIAPGFSHACSLFAVSLLLWLWLRARAKEQDTLADWVAIGVAGGLAGLVREQDALFLVIPAADLLRQSLGRRSFRAAALRGVAMGLAAAALFVPQMAAYRVLNGTFGPSKMVARKMTYSSPHFMQVLFDPGHGLYLWSPLLLVATVGLVCLVVCRRDFFSSLLLVAFLLQVWINGSLESWTQAGAFGARRFVSTTPILAWGLAALLTTALRRLGRGPCIAGLALFVWWNVSLMVQFGLKLMDRQHLEWPRVAVNQVREVPPRLTQAAVLFFTDRERLVKEGL